MGFFLVLLTVAVVTNDDDMYLLDSCTSSINHGMTSKVMTLSIKPACTFSCACCARCVHEPSNILSTPPSFHVCCGCCDCFRTTNTHMTLGYCRSTRGRAPSTKPTFEAVCLGETFSPSISEKRSAWLVTSASFRTTLHINAISKKPSQHMIHADNNKQVVVQFNSATSSRQQQNVAQNAPLIRYSPYFLYFIVRVCRFLFIMQENPYVRCSKTPCVCKIHVGPL